MPVDPAAGRRLLVGWRRRSSANKNNVLRKEYRREDQYLSIEIQPFLAGVVSAPAARRALAPTGISVSL